MHLLGCLATRGATPQGYGTGKGAGYTPIVGNFFVTVTTCLQAFWLMSLLELHLRAMFARESICCPHAG